ncbi:(2Fe-2S)-binding protein [Phreatobacter cathodiphilus]|uniref:(2Fe-2S)-binding protein n=1 Tax=Phreatobacter cathodiphilus TaxID=1868589 RepID=UPI001FE76726|nr:(2Fe-2S)-binding protein [Phreatobacter cathodiphilus]
MIVCHCNVLSDHDIRACLGDGPDCPRAVGEVYTCLGCSPECGRCARTIRAIMREAGVGGCAACPVGECAGHAHDGAAGPVLVAAE